MVERKYLQEPDIESFYANRNRFTKGIAFFDQITSEPRPLYTFRHEVLQPADPASPRIPSR
jgi:hypothetical protein